MKILLHIGKYAVFLSKIFRRPQKFKVFINNIFFEIEKLGINSIVIVFIISIFMGAVITLQAAYNIQMNFVPAYIIGYGTRDSLFLEFSSTIVALILAGKVGAGIASEIGTMKIREQIEALDIMGVNSESHLVLPKIIAGLFSFPLLSLFSMFIGLIGGYLVTVLTAVIPPGEYLVGIRSSFVPYYITYSLIKMTVFGFVIVTVPAYHAYYVRGGALEVGRAGTKGVVYSSLLILFFNVVLTQLLLS
ncbi:MAG: ABC transporter permease [Bacteroidia bacterium]|nr:MAG: ABC transporter permease [Bacteroidia bacterium]